MSTLFDAEALAKVPASERGYVAGHALGIYLYAQTLPRWVEGAGYTYRPGVSAREVGYSYSALVTGEVDTPAPLPGDECYRSGKDVICPDDNTTTPPPADDDDDDDDPEGRLDDDCESFLDPAAMQARAIGTRLELDDVDNAQLDRDDVEAGLADALALEDRKEDTDKSEPQHLKKDVREEGLCEHSPLILDLDGDGIELGDAKLGVLFDLKETGRPVRTAWPGKRDALLVLDKNGDGKITDGGELFGTSVRESSEDGERYEDGFEALAALDLNEDGVIDAKDPAAAQLRLWLDANRNGISEPEELTLPSSEGIVSLSLRSDRKLKFDRDGNMLPLWGEFVRVLKDGAYERGTMVDAWFRIRAAEAPPQI